MKWLQNVQGFPNADLFSLQSNYNLNITCQLLTVFQKFNKCICVPEWQQIFISNSHIINSSYHIIPLENINMLSQWLSPEQMSNLPKNIRPFILCPLYHLFLCPIPEFFRYFELLHAKTRVSSHQKTLYVPKIVSNSFIVLFLQWIV